jgi:hypothetical protein
MENLHSPQSRPLANSVGYWGYGQGLVSFETKKHNYHLAHKPNNKAYFCGCYPRFKVGAEIKFGFSSKRYKRFLKGAR